MKVSVSLFASFYQLNLVGIGESSHVSFERGIFIKLLLLGSGTKETEKLEHNF